MLRSIVPALLLQGCYEPPDLPLLEEIPVVGESQTCDSEREGQVACTVDGDTFDLSVCGEGLGERFRLLGVSAPEIAHTTSETSECWGEAAHEALEALIGGRAVVLTFDVDCTDLYGRTLAYAWLVGDELDHLRGDPDLEDYLGKVNLGDDEDALLVNEWLVFQGHARVFEPEIFGALIWQQRLEAAQSRAQQASKGLWGACETDGG